MDPRDRLRPLPDGAASTAGGARVSTDVAETDRRDLAEWGHILGDGAWSGSVVDR